MRTKWWGRRFRLPIGLSTIRAFALPFWVAPLLLPTAAHAQVLAPEEIRDPQLRALQEKYRNELKSIPQILAAHEFPYKFYFSRRLDVAEKDQPRNDQRSVQFDRYKGKVVLKITGNYFASYSAELMKPEERARETYQEVMLPLLRACMRALEHADAPQAFAFEISHHVRRKVLGISSEAAENVVLILPKGSAERMLNSTDPKVQEVSMADAEVFLNAVPVSLWPAGAGPSAGDAGDLVAGGPKASPAASGSAGSSSGVAGDSKPSTTPPAPTVSPRLLQGITIPALTMKTQPERDSSPQALNELQKSYQSILDRIVQELDMQAHFVSYAPPTFIAFHNGIYLQLSLNTTLPGGAAGSQYRLAALAFDQHIAHLIRPVYTYFKGRNDFDGIDFSATVRVGAGEESTESAMAVEFLLPLPDVRAYAAFDCTGQQLIEGSYVLINGERISLNLQTAEAAAVGR